MCRILLISCSLQEVLCEKYARVSSLHNEKINVVSANVIS